VAHHGVELVFLVASALLYHAELIASAWRRSREQAGKSTSAGVLFSTLVTAGLTAGALIFLYDAGNAVRGAWVLGISGVYTALGFLLGAASNLLADGGAFTAIDFPGAASTQAWGITHNGDIIGFYVSADKATHGFLLSRGQYSSIDFPGAAFTELNGISPRGDLIGIMQPH